MSIIDTIRAAAERRRAYNRLVGEIEGMTDRECADVGISRGDARRIARQTYYG